MRFVSVRLIATLVGVVAAVLGIGVGNAGAYTCTFAGGVVSVTYIGETVTLSKGNLSAINVNGVQCGTATTSNTQWIETLGDDGAAPNGLIIDLGGGRFEPGIGGPPEGTGLNEIEILFGGVVGDITILGGPGADTINVGSGGAAPDINGDGFAETGYFNLNGDDDADVLVNAIQGAIFSPRNIFGRGGNDIITAKGGLGTGSESGPAGVHLDGGEGDDSLQGGDGDDLLVGGPGNDVIDGDDDFSQDSTCDEIELDPVTGQIIFPVFNGDPDIAGDTVSYTGSAGPITLDLDPGELHPGSATGDGTDVLQNLENIVGSPANDVLSGDNAGNHIAGGAGDDTIAGDAGDDCELGSDGNDTFDENEGTSTAQGGTGTDNGADVIFGNAGLDDTITYSARTTRVNVFLEALLSGFLRSPLGIEFECGNETDDRAPVGFVGFAPDGADLDGDGFSGDDENDCVFQDTENVITGSGNDLISAAFVNNRADNEFTDNAGNDLMDGGAGNDTFHQGAAAQGSDDMDGGTGSDLCDYSLRTNPVSVNLDGADNDGEAGEGDNCGGVVDTFFFIGGPGRTPLGGPDEGDPIAGQDVENVAGGSGNDNLTGSDEANVLSGNAGNDTLTGNGGTDVLNGGDGDDWMIPGAGNDTAAGGAGTDTVDYASAGAGGVGVNVNLATGQASGEGNDTISDTENASGSSFADSIRGNTGANVLNARGGNDAVQGSDGDDTINGGAGADVLNGNGANDRVTGGTGQDTIRGGGGNDNLNGGPAADTIYGGAGNDVLSGGAGPDDHRGGPGTDRCNPGAPGLGRGDTAQGCEA
jgi:Ca2+-binding RTX toxin-like protein